MQSPKLESNIWKYAVILIANKRIFAAILGAYYLTIPDVTAQTIGFILLIGQVAGFIFEIPSGYVSDKIGHKQAIVISRFLFIISTLFFLFAETTLFLILGSVFLSIGLAFLSGTGTAFMHETLRGLNREHEYTKVMGKISSIGFAVPIILTVLTPFLISISYKAPFVVALVIDVIGLIVSFFLIVPKVPPEHVEEVGLTNFKQVIQAGYKLGFFKYALFVSFTAAILFAIGMFRAPYQLLLEIPVIWYGVLFGIGRALASLLLAYSGQIKDHFSTVVSFYKFEIALYSVLILLLAATVDPWVVGGMFMVINGFQWGLTQVSRGFILEIIRDSKFKATLISVESQMENLMAGVFSFGLGFAIENTTYQIAFFGIGIIFLLFSVPLYFYIKNNHKLKEATPSPLPTTP